MKNRDSLRRIVRICAFCAAAALMPGCGPDVQSRDVTASEGGRCQVEGGLISSAWDNPHTACQHDRSPASGERPGKLLRCEVDDYDGVFSSGPGHWRVQADCPELCRVTVYREDGYVPRDWTESECE